MLIVLMAAATALLWFWFSQLPAVTQEDWVNAASCKVLDNREKVAQLRRQDAAKKIRLTQYYGLTGRVVRAVAGGDSTKEIDKLEKKNEALQGGDLSSLRIFPMPGYVLQRRYEKVGKSGIYKKIYNGYVELHGKKYAAVRTENLLAKLLSYPILGSAVIFMLATIELGQGESSAGAGILVLGLGLVFLFAYAQYDDVSDQVNKRQDAIRHQFPNVVSKLALLVSSGMIMDRAWRQAAESGDGELYLEMRRTADQIDNLVSPEAAYGEFINRCNTKETSKLASAILQNQSKGNAEIGKLLRDMAAESWLERRNLAKRDSDKANSKLMIPTMLLFLSILVMLMVPVVRSFSNL